MKYTKKERIAGLERMALRLISSYNSYGLCNTFANYSELSYCIYDMEEVFPELEKYRPNRQYTEYWFPLDEDGNAERIAIILCVIEEIKSCV